MKLRLLKELNGKPAGKVGIYLSEYSEELIRKGIAERLDDDYVVEEMPKKAETQQEPVYIPIPVPMEYFNGDDAENAEKKINKPKNK